MGRGRYRAGRGVAIVEDADPIYLANRGFKTANIPIVVESRRRPALFRLKHPLVVGLTTGTDRLVQVRRNRLLSLNQAPETAYVDAER